MTLGKSLYLCPIVCISNHLALFIDCSFIHLIYVLNSVLGAEDRVMNKIVGNKNAALGNLTVLASRLTYLTGGSLCLFSHLSKGGKLRMPGWFS